MSQRTEFPAKAPEGTCNGMWKDENRNLSDWKRTGWAPCEMPEGHVCPCGPLSRFQAGVERLGPRACHVVNR